jgi:hypothetical protein
VLLRLLALAHALVELAEAEVAVGDEGAHAARRCVEEYRCRNLPGPVPHDFTAPIAAMRLIT